MNIFPQKKSDAEFVESIRKSYQRRWMAFSLMLLFSITILAVSVYFGHRYEKKIQETFNDGSKIHSSSKEMNNLHSDVSSYSEFILGFIVGKGIMIGCFGIILSISFIYRRKDAMLLEYYDKNKRNS